MASRPLHRALDNVSKAFQTLVDAKAKYGGWSDKNGTEKCIVILGGPYCGTYSWTALRLNYYMDFRQLHTEAGKAKKIVQFQNKKLLDLLLPTAKIVHEALLKVSPVYADSIKNSIKEYNRILSAPDTDFAYEYEPRDPDIGGEDRDFNNTQTREQTLLGIPDARPLESPRSKAYKTSQLLYILSQVSGTPMDAVLQDIQEQPKRLLSLSGMPRMQRATDRAKFAKEFLSSWSIQKAVKKCIPNVEGNISVSMPAVEDARYAFNYVPSWMNIARVWGNTEDPRPRPRPPRGVNIDPAETGRIEILFMAQDFKELKVPATAFRKLLTSFTKNQLTNLRDVLRRMEPVREQLAETLEGRRILEARVRQDYRALLRAHDFVMAIPYNRTTKGITAEQAAEWHKNALRLRCPVGVRPLLTIVDFTTEGQEMDHCVGGYFWQRKSWCFAFQASDGTRATLEIRPVGELVKQLQRDRHPLAPADTGPFVVVQFQGVGNTAVSYKCRELLNTFKAVNAGLSL